jgi:hypothetical protein
MVYLLIIELGGAIYFRNGFLIIDENNDFSSN